MQSKHLFIVIAFMLATFFIVRAIFYEKKLVSELNWYKSYDFESEDPYGAHVFYNLVEHKYGKDNILLHHKDTLINEIESSDNVYVSVSRSRHLNYEDQEDIKRFVSKGNSALIISSQFYPNLNLSDSTWISSENYFKGDSIFKFKFEGITDSMSFKNYNKSGDRPTPFYPSTFILDDDQYFTKIATHDTAVTVFFESRLDTGVVYQHIVPELFSNIASKQDFYLPHFNATFGFLEGKTVILDHPSFNSKFEDYPTDSYLEYILSAKSLKWAYYTFLFTTIGFLVFRGKRKQRVIPIPEKNENTSIQYVDTLSELFELQGQNEKLVPHMESVFLHRVKQKYYLAPDNERFVEILSKKSRVPENQITAILNYFKNGKGIYDFSDDQLIMLHKRLEDFYNNAE